MLSFPSHGLTYGNILHFRCRATIIAGIETDDNQSRLSKCVYYSKVKRGEILRLVDARPHCVTVNYVFLWSSRSHCPLLSLRVGEASWGPTRQQHQRQSRCRRHIFHSGELSRQLWHLETQPEITAATFRKTLRIQFQTHVVIIIHTSNNHQDIFFHNLNQQKKSCGLKFHMGSTTWSGSLLWHRWYMLKQKSIFLKW